MPTAKTLAIVIALAAWLCAPLTAFSKVRVEQTPRFLQPVWIIGLNNYSVPIIAHSSSVIRKSSFTVALDVRRLVNDAPDYERDDHSHIGGTSDVSRREKEHCRELATTAWEDGCLYPALLSRGGGNRLQPLPRGFSFVRRDGYVRSESNFGRGRVSMVLRSAIELDPNALLAKVRSTLLWSPKAALFGEPRSALGRQSFLGDIGLAPRVASGKPSHDSRDKYQSSSSTSDDPLPLGVPSSIICGLSRPNLLAQVVLVVWFGACFGGGFYGGWIIPERPKLGIAVGAAGFIGLFAALVGIPLMQC
ncbi:MAG: hypothetical protein AB7E81_14435 [Hyphomicrobiaceae bacterium]